MKALFVLILLSYSFGVLTAQTDLNTALGKGDVAAIGAHLDDKVEITIGTSEVLVSKGEAETKLREFYSGVQAKGFRSMHAGSSTTAESTYSIGELSTDKGIYRVYIYFAQSGDKRKIAELRFEQ